MFYSYTICMYCGYESACTVAMRWFERSSDRTSDREVARSGNGARGRAMGRTVSVCRHVCLSVGLAVRLSNGLSVWAVGRVWMSEYANVRWRGLCVCPSSLAMRSFLARSVASRPMQTREYMISCYKRLLSIWSCVCVYLEEKSCGCAPNRFFVWPPL